MIVTNNEYDARFYGIVEQSVKDISKSLELINDILYNPELDGLDTGEQGDNIIVLLGKIVHDANIVEAMKVLADLRD